MAKQTPIEIGCSEQPVHDRERQVHVALHHNVLVVVRSMVPTQRIDERHMADKRILINVAAEVHELIDQVHRRCGCNEEPADIC